MSESSSSVSSEENVEAIAPPLIQSPENVLILRLFQTFVDEQHKMRTRIDNLELTVNKLKANNQELNDQLKMAKSNDSFKDIQGTSQVLNSQSSGSNSAQSYKVPLLPMYVPPPPQFLFQSKTVPATIYQSAIKPLKLVTYEEFCKRRENDNMNSDKRTSTLESNQDLNRNVRLGEMPSSSYVYRMPNTDTHGNTRPATIYQSAMSTNPGSNLRMTLTSVRSDTHHRESQAAVSRTNQRGNKRKIIRNVQSYPHRQEAGTATFPTGAIRGNKKKRMRSRFKSMDNASCSGTKQ